MSKAEDLAKEFLKKLVSHATLYEGTIDELEVYEPDDVIWAYKEGYHQAEKDLELTWEDLKLLQDISHEVFADVANGSVDYYQIYSTEQSFLEEVLKRCKARKGK